MKKFFLLFLLFIFYFQTFGQFDTILHPGQVNVATLVVDYQTHYYEGGNMAHYNCSSCTGDSIPLNILYESPMDFGRITFRLNPSLDTIFDGTIVWMGLGQIMYPQTFGTNAPFNYSASSVVNIPNDLVYLRIDGQPLTNSNDIEGANQAWSSISDLGITEIYSMYGFKAAVYLYAPSVGLFDPDPAKWIIFLYQNELTSGLENNSFSNPEISIFPNPSDGILKISSVNEFLEETNYSIFSLQGELIQMGKIQQPSNEIYLDAIESGNYILQITNPFGEMIGRQKLSVLK